MGTEAVVIQRHESTEQGTFGVMQFGQNSIYTIELPWRDNARQRSCIPPGTYDVRIVQSPKFGRVYQVLNVLGRDHVLIHPANFAGDVDQGWESQLHGCIAPCLRIGQMRNSSGRMQAAGLVSRPGWTRFMEWAAGRPLKLEIRPC